MGFFFPSMCKKCIVGPMCSRECREHKNNINKRIKTIDFICKVFIATAIIIVVFGGIIQNVLKFFR
jgi:hypothetical protein